MPGWPLRPGIDPRGSADRSGPLGVIVNPAISLIAGFLPIGGKAPTIAEQLGGTTIEEVVGEVAAVVLRASFYERMAAVLSPVHQPGEHMHLVRLHPTHAVENREEVAAWVDTEA